MVSIRWYLGSLKGQLGGVGLDLPSIHLSIYPYIYPFIYPSIWGCTQTPCNNFEDTAGVQYATAEMASQRGLSQIPRTLTMRAQVPKAAVGIALGN